MDVTIESKFDINEKMKENYYNNKKRKNIIKNEEERKWYECLRNRKPGNRNMEVTLEIFMKKKSKASMGKIVIEIFLKKKRRENTVEIIIKS